MKHTRLLLLVLLILVVAAASFAGGLFIGVRSGMPAGPGVLVVIHNKGDVPLTDLRVDIGGEQIDLGTLAPQATARGSAIPSADSTIAVTYRDVDGARKALDIDEYITGGTRGHVDAEIKDGAIVRSHANLKFGP